MSIAKPRSANLIDTLSAGYRTLHRRLWVLAIPAGLSAYLWLGAPVALGAAGAELRQALVELVRGLGGDQQAGEQWARRVLTDDARLGLAWLNYVPVLPPADGAAGAAVGLRGPLQVAGAAATINGLALLLSGLYLAVLGEAARGERATTAESVRRAGQVAAHILLYLLTLVGVGLVLALPLLAISAILVITVPGAALLVFLAWYVALFWAYVYTGFAPEAISVSRAGPLRAIYNSVHIVRRNLAGTLGLLLLSVLIGNGLAVLWRQLAATPAGLAVAIVGSAYVGSGLAAARLEFYREGLARWGDAHARRV